MRSSPDERRLLVLDSDPVFLAGLQGRAPAAGWELLLAAQRPPLAELLSLKLRSALIDPAVPAGDLWGYLHRVRAAMPDLGLLVCAERAPLADRVRGLRLGADDWIAKPVHPDEVLARIEAVCRRPRLSPPPSAQPLRFGELEIHPHGYRAIYRDGQIELTRREFEVLNLLASNHGQVIERTEIYRCVWGYELPPGDRSVDVFILKLRTKLRKATNAEYLHTHFHIGYRFDPPTTTEATSPPTAEMPREPESFEATRIAVG